MTKANIIQKQKKKFFILAFNDVGRCIERPNASLQELN